MSREGFKNKNKPNFDSNLVSRIPSLARRGLKNPTLDISEDLIKKRKKNTSMVARTTFVEPLNGSINRSPRPDYPKFSPRLSVNKSVIENNSDTRQNM